MWTILKNMNQIYIYDLQAILYVEDVIMFSVFDLGRMYLVWV